MYDKSKFVGRVFFFWTAVEYAGHGTDGRDTWKCLCQCGAEKVVQYRRLKYGLSKSCGCTHFDKEGNPSAVKAGVRATYRKRSAAEIAATPTDTRTYNSWHNMKSRCYDSSHVHFAYYGGRGVIICDRWLESYGNFLADMGNRPEDTTLDRIDPFGNYEPANCRWATQKEQNENRRRAVTGDYKEFLTTTCRYTSRKTGITKTYTYTKPNKARHRTPKILK